MTKFERSSFSEYMGGNQEYRDSWDAIFQHKEPTLVPDNSSIQAQVRQFHTVFKQPIGDKPKVPDEASRIHLRLKLIAEEFLELLDACGCRTADLKDLDNGIQYTISRVEDEHPVDLVEVADALGDIAYVTEGAALEFGIDSKRVLAEIQRSNLSKLGPNGEPIYNEAGKVTKGPSYSPPDISKCLT